MPLGRHGQGVQSLSVLFLFKAFTELVLESLYRPESAAVLALEEPETHLHPQAARSLWSHVNNLQGQKIITTHSPYFLQYVPFRDIRVLRSTPTGTAVRSVPREFRATAPHVLELDSIVEESEELISYDRGLGEIIIHGTLEQAIYRQLLAAYHGRKDTQEIHASLRAARDASLEYISDTELDQLETFAKRIRGEIFFARKWLLVEGQSEYHLVHGIAQAMDYNLDENGVSVIDFQNNGNPVCFAILARALGYPWLIVVDGDQAGQSYLEKIATRGFSEGEMQQRAFSLPNDFLESQLVADGLQQELKNILTELGCTNANDLNDEELVEELKEYKGMYAASLARNCALNADLGDRMPEPFRQAIESLRTLS